MSEELKLLASVERALGAAYRQSHTVENIMKDLRPKIETALAAKLAEREAEVVAWLRGEVPTNYTDPQFDIGQNLANAIERGEHRATKDNT